MLKKFQLQFTNVQITQKCLLLAGFPAQSNPCGHLPFSGASERCFSLVGSCHILKIRLGLKDLQDTKTIAHCKLQH
jgi:hypothetical protein